MASTLLKSNSVVNITKLIRTKIDLINWQTAALLDTFFREQIFMVYIILHIEFLVIIKMSQPSIITCVITLRSPIFLKNK